MSDIRVKMAKDLRDMSDMVGDLHWMSAKAIEDLVKKDGEIAKRDARILELEEQRDRFMASIERKHKLMDEDAAEIDQLRAELVALKDAATTVLDGLNERIAYAVEQRQTTPVFEGIAALHSAIYAAPVSEAEAQGEYGDAYQGAREDLAIWKRRALEAEEKVLQQEQIIDHLTSEAQGESRFGEPVVTPDAPCVPDGYVLADKKALGTVLQALVNAPHHIRELQVTRQPVELFSDNPINVLIANYEAPAAPAAPAADAWIQVSERLPSVAAGKAIEVIVAVKRKHNGQVYVFTTEYLNCVQVNQDGQFVQDDDNDNAAITGWFYLSDDDETWHRTLGDGDELLAWQYKPAYAANRAQWVV
jgi:hypothetical protein